MKTGKQLLLIVTLAVASRAKAVTGQTGTTAAQFLKLGSGARPLALGEAYVALADDPAGMQYNPAGLACMPVSAIQFSHNAWFGGAMSEHLGLGLASQQGWSWGLSLNYLALPSQSLTQATGAGSSDPGDNYRETGTFSPSEYYGSFNGAVEALPGLKLGAGLKAMGASLAGSSGFGLGLDAGLIYQGLAKGLSLGLCAQNMGPSMKVSDDSFALPLLLRSGAGWRFWNDRLLASVEADLPNDNQAVFSTGLEACVWGLLYPRLGYRVDGDFDPWSLGAGMRQGPLCLDLAVVPYGDLGLTYRGSLSYQLGGPAASAACKPPEALAVKKPEPKPALALGIRIESPAFCNHGPGPRPSIKPIVSGALEAQAWVLAIYSVRGNGYALVFDKKGQGPLPASWEWDGRDAAGKALPEGSYVAACGARTLGGQSLFSPYARIEIRNPAAAAERLAEPSHLEFKVLGPGGKGKPAP